MFIRNSFGATRRLQIRPEGETVVEGQAASHCPTTRCPPLCLSLSTLQLLCLSLLILSLWTLPLILYSINSLPPVISSFPFCSLLSFSLSFLLPFPLGFLVFSLPLPSPPFILLFSSLHIFSPFLSSLLPPPLLPRPLHPTSPSLASPPLPPSLSPCSPPLFPSPALSPHPVSSISPLCRKLG